MKYSFTFLIFLVFSSSFMSFSNNNNELVERNNEFSFSIFNKLSESEKCNLFISPFSISTALSMTYDGARWFTAWEMHKALNFNRNRNRSHEEFTSLLNYYKKSEKYDFLNIANAAVAQEGYSFLESYFKLVKNYNAKLSTVNFRDDVAREEAREDINKWVAENTNNRIEELLDETALNALTRLVLLNAIHFKADWKHEFPKDKTRQMTFYASNENTIASFMQQRDSLNFFQNDSIQMIELPYKDNTASMHIIMPQQDKDINEFAQNLSYSHFKEFAESYRKLNIELAVPKFKIETEYELKETLISMGMERAFSHNANFSGMTGNKELMIDEVIHKAFIEIDEKGSEAAAATAVVIRQKSTPRYIKVSFNRPFIILIKENTKNSILFIGKINNPTKV